MFIVLSQRPEFVRDWATVLERRGPVRQVTGLGTLRKQIQGLVPRVVVIDFELIRTDALVALKEVRNACREARLLIAGAAFTSQQELAALAAGMAACCDAMLKQDELERIVDVVLQGGVWVSRSTIPLLVSKLQHFSVHHVETTGDRAGEADPIGGLTERQLEVAKMVSQGASNKQIAQSLSITDRTVKAHLTAIFEKLNVPDRLHLALYIKNRE